jgi:hydrogenase maturation protein HypF
MNDLLSDMPYTLAMGADMKSAFALQHQGNTYISQYLGDLELLHSQQRFDMVLKRLSSLLHFKAESILIDQHPAYYSSQKGKELADREQIPVISFQHHKAHFASVLAENKLLENDNILGVVWDGLGYGEDNQIWGGEFFDYSDKKIRRINHVPYFPVLAGDKMSSDPRLSAYSLLRTINMEEHISELFNEKELAVYSNLTKKSKLSTSSMGRVFDALAAVLLPGKRNTFEGEAAMTLEALAGNFLKNSIKRPHFEFETDLDSQYAALWILQAIKAIEQGVSHGEIAAAFHFALADLIMELAVVHGFQKLAFSGGVFQNALLTDIMISEMQEDFQLYFHKELAPNDECIAFGQLALQKIEIDKTKQLITLENELH